MGVSTVILDKRDPWGRQIVHGGVPLSDEQARIVVLVARARLDKQIAHELGVTEAVVKNQLAAIKRKTGARNRVELALWWYGISLEALRA